MRLVKVKAPKGKAGQIAEIAFSVGLKKVAVHQAHVLRSEGGPERAAMVEDIVEIEASTPIAKLFIDQLLAAPFFNVNDYGISVRQPRSIINHEEVARITWPLAEPSIDIYQELWQFSQVTYGFIGRILIGAILLAYGLVEYNLLFMIAGLLFIPLLPLMLAVGFGLLTRELRLARQALMAFSLATILLLTGGVLVAQLTHPPLRYNESTPLLTGMLISLAVGVAAGLATADDVGRREMIGLAATAQVAILPVWFGICFVFGFPALESTPPARRALIFLLNVSTLIVASSATYAVLGMKRFASRSFGSTNEA
jgi:hypothetical protein